MPFFNALAEILLRVQPLAVVCDFHNHEAGFMSGFEPYCTRRFFPGANTFCLLFDPMVGCISNHVRQGIGESFYQAFIKFHVFSRISRSISLFDCMRYVSHDPWKLAEYIAYRLHASLHDGILQFGSDQIDALGTGNQRPVVILRHGFPQLVAAEDEFSRQIHKAFEQLDIHAKCAFSRGYTRPDFRALRFRMLLPAPVEEQGGFCSEKSPTAGQWHFKGGRYRRLERPVS